MTAKKYFAKYKAALCDMEHPERQQMAIQSLLRDFENEQQKVSVKWRTTNHAISNIVKDFNEKWNAISRMVTKVTGAEILMIDGWSLYMGEVINV